jgi:2-methylcitrate dehydratase PrpD
MSSDADPARLVDRLGSRWTVLETSFKYHASCRHTHPAADALLQVVEALDLAAKDIAGIVAHVHQGAIDVLGPVIDPVTVHQAKFSMPATLGLVAAHRRAGMAEFDAYFADDAARAFLNCVEMKLDPEVDAAYPNRWIGKVSVTTTSGKTLDGRVDEPKGDPGNTLSRDEIDAKARRLAAYGKSVDTAGIDRLMPLLWSIAERNEMGRLL